MAAPLVTAGKRNVLQARTLPPFPYRTFRPLRTTEGSFFAPFIYKKLHVMNDSLRIEYLGGVFLLPKASASFSPPRASLSLIF